MNKSILYKFFRGSATLEEEEILRQWYESSPANQEIFLQERKLYNLTTLHPKTNRLKIKFSLFNHSGSFKEIIKIAGIILLTLIGGQIYQSVKTGHYREKTQTIHVPSTQRVNLILPDGTEVWLNAHASLRYGNDYGQTTRTVELMGEAFFEIKKEKDKPFIVNTPYGEIEALGTSFNVNIDEEREKMETVLMDGKIKVTPHLENQMPVIMKPNQKIVITKTEMNLSQIEGDIKYLWKENQISFVDTPFEELIQTFSSYFNIEIEIANPDIKQYRCTSKFKQHDGIYYALYILQKRYDFHFKLDADLDKIIIY